jgi:hypothetical protein
VAHPIKQYSEEYKIAYDNNKKQASKQQDRKKGEYDFSFVLPNINWRNSVVNP